MARRDCEGEYAIADGDVNVRGRWVVGNAVRGACLDAYAAMLGYMRMGHNPSEATVRHWDWMEKRCMSATVRAAAAAAQTMDVTLPAQMWCVAWERGATAVRTGRNVDERRIAY